MVLLVAVIPQICRYTCTVAAVANVFRFIVAPFTGSGHAVSVDVGFG
jgi:hypothetical protein